MSTEIKHFNIKNNYKLLSTKLTVKIVIYLYRILSFIFSGTSYQRRCTHLLSSQLTSFFIKEIKQKQKCLKYFQHNVAFLVSYDAERLKTGICMMSGINQGVVLSAPFFSACPGCLFCVTYSSQPLFQELYLPLSFKQHFPFTQTPQEEMTFLIFLGKGT